MIKAAFLHGPRDIRITEIAEEMPAAGELLIDVTAVGVCGSDLHTYLNGQIGDTVAAAPLMLGHEAAGRVVALGTGLEGKFQIGQSIAIDPAIPCDECERCLEGNPNLCTRLQFIGLWPRQGALRERMVHPAKSCVPLPDSISPMSAALLEPLGVAIHADHLAKIRLNDDVLVIGCGAIGLLLIRLARLAGARRIFASDPHSWRRTLAQAWGADVVVNSSEEDVVSRVHHLTGERGVDVAIESAWVKDTANQCVDAVRNGGRVIIVGIPAEDAITVRASAARRKGLSIKLSRRMKHTYPAAIDLVVSGRVNLDQLATHRFDLEHSALAFETAAEYRDGVIRAMILPQPRN